MHVPKLLVLKKHHPHRFAFSEAYDTEQRQDVADLKREIERQEQQNQNLEQFIEKVKRNSELIELTPYAVHGLIQKINVEEPDKSSGKRTQSIHISCDFVGFILINELLKEQEA